MSQARWALIAALSLLTATTVRAAPSPRCADDDPNCSVPHEPVNTTFAARVVGAPAGTPLTGDALEKRTEQVAREIRCPVCQGSSIGDSPSATARNMKQEVHDLLAAGFTQEQILNYFESSYGEFVRLAPKTTGFTTVVWVAPALLFLFGLVVVAMFFRRRSAAPQAAAPAPTVAAAPSDDPSLEPFLQQVRGMAGSQNPTDGSR